MARASVKITRTATTTRTKTNGTSHRGNPNKCPTCGKYTSKG